MFGGFYTVFDTDSGYDSPGAWREIRFFNCWFTFVLFFPLVATCVRSNDSRYVEARGSSREFSRTNCWNLFTQFEIWTVPNMLNFVNPQIPIGNKPRLLSLFCTGREFSFFLFLKTPVLHWNQYDWGNFCLLYRNFWNAEIFSHTNT